MEMEQSRENVPVWRITVDEKLADDLIRLLTSPLAKGVREFYDGKNDWGEEEECLIYPGTYVREMGIPESEAGEWLWADLKEGQVFLSGQFEVVGDMESPEKFVVSPGQRNFLRIDGLVRRDIKRLYFKLLETRRQDGNSH